MAHWESLQPARMIDVEYEVLVSESEEEIRRILAGCDLDFDEACLRFHQSNRSVSNASQMQVRRPIHAKSVGQDEISMFLLTLL